MVGDDAPFSSVGMADAPHDIMLTRNIPSHSYYFYDSSWPLFVLDFLFFFLIQVLTIMLICFLEERLECLLVVHGIFFKVAAFVYDFYLTHAAPRCSS